MPEFHRTIVVPMWREAPRIERTIRDLADSPLHSPGTEFIFVDDASDDETATIVADLLDELGFPARLISLERHLGKGGAVQAGVMAARGDAVAFADADLSAGVDEIDRCLKWVEAEQADLVITTRARPDSVIAVHQPALRQLSGKVFNRVVRALGLTEYPDTQCGLKAFTREAARELFAGLTVTGFAFDVELLLRARRLGLAVVELPIEWRHFEASRVSALHDSTRMLRDVLILWWRERHAGTSQPKAMQAGTFETMARLETEHWWFRAKRELVAEAVGAPQNGSATAVDVGCGTGAMLEDLRRLGWTTVGTDLSPFALQLARGRGSAVGSAVARAEQLPLPAGSASVLVSLDVVEHLDDDVAAIAEYARVVRPDGTIILAVPAYSWAWSDHDVELGHRRRYTAGRLRQAAEAAGLRVERCTYFHSWLVPPALVLRKTPLRRLLRGGAEEASYVNPSVNRALSVVSRLERAALRHRDLPFGLSILLIGRPADR
ncbi:MAG: glycosyltransferase [Acidimicrobiia bacterium]